MRIPLVAGFDKSLILRMPSNFFECFPIRHQIHGIGHLVRQSDGLGLVHPVIEIVGNLYWAILDALARCGVIFHVSRR